MFLSGRPFDQYSAPPARLGSQISRGGIPQKSTDTRFYGLQNVHRENSSRFIEYSQSLSTLFCVVSSRACFIFLVCGRQCLEIHTWVHTRNTKFSWEEITYLLTCAGYHWRYRHRDTRKTCFSSGLKNCYWQQEDAPWCPVGYLKFYLARTKTLFITTTGSTSHILTTALSRWIVAFVWRAYERLVIPMPQAHPGISTQVHYLRILCQTAVYFQDVSVFQERSVGNCHARWTLVLHFIGVISGQNILKAVLRDWGLRFLVLGRKILECGYRFYTTTSYLHHCTWIQPDIILKPWTWPSRLTAACLNQGM